MAANIFNSQKYLTVIFFFMFFTTLFMQPSYKMSLEGGEKLGETTKEISIYIQSTSEDFELTSYQCALSFNQNIDLTSLSFEYVEGSSEIVNEPNLYVGVDNIDGSYELTFVSYIGNDVISSSKKLIGKFIVSSSNINTIDNPNIQWNFDGTISTILTGKDFVNITNPSYHVSNLPVISNTLTQTAKKVTVVSSEASAVYGDKFTDKMLFDGITSSSNGGNYNSSSDGRWAVEGFPQWVTVDLGEETIIEHIAIDPYDSENGTTYDCEFYSGRYNEGTLIKKETTANSTQWSEHYFDGLKTRYLTIVVTGSKGNDWCDFWELEVYGINSTTEVDDNQTTDIEEIPTEFGISQNYPNPFNPTTKVEVSMKNDGYARLTVYNLLGEKMIDVLDGELTAGLHEVNINATGLPSGVYVYKLDVDNGFSQIKKMNLIK